MDVKYVCRKCNSEYERDSHYKHILDMQNIVNLMTGTEEISDMCGKCSHAETDGLFIEGWL